MRKHTLCKRKYNHEYVEVLGVGVVFNTFTYQKAGYIRQWELAISDGNVYDGTTIEEFIDLLNELKDKYELNKRTQYNKDTLIIYCNNIPQIYGFLRNYDSKIEKFHDYYFTFLEVYEFRDISIWYDVTNSAIDIANHAQVLMNVFGEEGKFYLTPTQSVLKNIKKNKDSDIAKELYPETYFDYYRLMQSYFGGILVANITDYIVDEKNDFRVVEYDRKSAYIYDLLIEKHLCEPLHKENVKNYKFFLENEDKYFAIIKIKIKTIKGIPRTLQYIKDIYKKRLKEDTETILVLTNTDLNIMIQECQLLIFEVLRIEVGKKDYLPRYVAEAIEREYAKKVKLEKLYAEGKISYEELHLQKVKVNSIYGATVKKIKDFKDSCKDPFLTPQWGVATSAFARKNLLKVASKVSNWLYSATDSIYCEDCEENAVIVDDFNNKCRTKIKDYCIKNCLDYDIFRDLGTYQAKEVIKKFYCLGKGTYMYTTVSGVFKITACGITTEYGEEAYHLKKLKAGKKVRLMYNHDITRCVIDGVEFISNGSSYDDYVDGDSIEFLSAMYYTVLINRRYI